jgi:hypothetical protein
VTGCDKAHHGFGNRTFDLATVFPFPMGGFMETRLDTFNGWQMRASVEGRPESGKSRYYIVPPLAYKEFSMAEFIHPAQGRYIQASFENADDAFLVAFGVCRRDIMTAIKLRMVQSFN